MSAKGSGSRRHITDEEFRRALRSEVRRSIIIHLIDAVATFANNLVKYGWPVAALFVLAWAWVNSASDLAGKQTRIDLAAEAIVDVAANKWFFLLVIAVLGSANVMQRKTFRKRLAELSDQKKKLEQLLDPVRSSSGMLQDGSAPDD